MTASANMQYRTNTGGQQLNLNATNIAGLTVPCWLQLRRAGSLWTASVSSDGNNWTIIGQLTLTLPATLIWQLATASASAGNPVTATYQQLCLQNLAQVAFAHITATGGSYTVRARDVANNVGAASGAVVRAPLQSSGIRFTPGHYIELDPGSGGGGLTGWLSTITTPHTSTASNGQPGLKGAANLKGVMLITSWANLEFAQNVYTQGSGSSAKGFAMLDQLLMACANSGLQFMLGVNDRCFGAAKIYTTPSSFGTLPLYFDTLLSGSPGYIDAPSGTTWTGSLEMIALMWNSTVMARYIALTQAYGARYDSNSHWEMWATSETSVGAPAGTGGFSFPAYIAQLEAWMPAARLAFPTSGLRISTNFFNTGAQFNGLFNAAIPYGICMGGPDVKLNLPGSPPFGGTANTVFNGYQGGADYRGVLPWAAEVQYPDLDGSATEAQLYAEMMTGSLVTGGSMLPQYFIWSASSKSSQFTLAQTLAFIAGNNPVNVTRPSSY
jgi:hypothetical protein